MALAMTLRSKISKTKKRLSDDQWQMPGALLGILGLFAILAFALRAATLTWNYGLVEASIPLLHVPLNDPMVKNFVAGKAYSVTKHTATVVMGERAFYVGDIGAFTDDYWRSERKFAVPHVQGQPQLGALIEILERWQRQQQRDYQIANTGVLVVVPSLQWPVAIVTQVLHYLRRAKLYDRVILAGGLR